MRCKHCEYELCHCTGRTCPECGAPFSLADYIFEKDEVYYHCPDCDYGIAGDDSEGKPSILPNTCESCQKLNTLEDFVIRPAPGYDFDVDGLQLPIRTLDGNMFTRYFSTVWLIMTKPKTAMARIPSQESLLYAFKFYMQTFVILFIVGMVPNLLFFGLMPGVAGGGLGWQEIIILFAQSLAMFVFASIFIVVFGCVSHAIMRMTGECKYPLHRTMQAVLYGGGASIAGLIPCCGGLLGFSWWIVASSNMFIRGQRISKGRAISAGVCSAIAILLFTCGAYILLMSAVMMPAISQARFQAISVQQVQKLKPEQKFPRLQHLQRRADENIITPEDQVELELLLRQMEEGLFTYPQSE